MQKSGYEKLKKREGEKEGKVEKRRGRKVIYLVSATHVLLLFTLDILYVSYFSIDMIRYHDQSNV